eukprot:scaffold275228_cov17-Tisochrysis_lutea.AAC.1
MSGSSSGRPSGPVGRSPVDPEELEPNQLLRLMIPCRPAPLLVLNARTPAWTLALRLLLGALPMLLPLTLSLPPLLPLSTPPRKSRPLKLSACAQPLGLVRASGLLPAAADVAARASCRLSLEEEGNKVTAAG